MTDTFDRVDPDDAERPPRQPQRDGANTLTPLPGEAGIPHVAITPPLRISRKSLLTLGLLLITLALGAGIWLHRWLGDFQTPRSPAPPSATQQPAAAATPPRRLDLSTTTPVAATVVTPASAPLIPALDPNAPLAEPIPVQRTGPAGPSGGGAPPIAPEDAPVLLVSSRPSAATAMQPAAAADDPMAATRQRLDAYQRQLQGLLQNLDKSTSQATSSPSVPPSAGSAFTPLEGPSPAPRAAFPRNPLLGGALPSSATQRVSATSLGHRSLTLPKGTAFTCALKTKVISANAGLVGCQVQRNVFSDDGRVLLIERGSHLDGEYRIASVRPGTTRIPLIWTRVRTPLGVVVDLESPATGPLGESGLEGHVNNRWRERIGAAMLVSLIDDALNVVVQNQTEDRGGDTVVLGSTTGNASELAEKVLDSTINIPPVISQHQGGLVGIYVARDVDFSSVYELRPGAR